ncbi:MAG: OsmC family protein [Kiritimatiellae bacterium]|nr:OsmC family protein [Kiritimatiellia bacterium]
MVPITVSYLGNLRCEATHGPSGSRIETDAPADNHGRAERFSPTDLVATALGSCMLTMLGIYARERGWDLTGSRAEVLKIMGGPPRRITQIQVRLHMPIALAPADRRELENLARGCPVARSLHPELRTDITFHWPRG